MHRTRTIFQSWDRGRDLDIDTSAGAGGGTPTTDTNSQACTTTPGNQAPGGLNGHPIDEGEFGNPGTFSHVHYVIDAYADSDEVWICLDIENGLDPNDFHRRIVIPLPSGGGTPDIDVELDEPHVAAPAEVAEGLRIEEGASCRFLRRVFLADGDPVGVADTWLPQALLGDHDELFENVPAAR